MQVISQINPELEGFRNEIPSNKGIKIPLRFIGASRTRLLSKRSKIVSTGVILKDTITLDQLNLDTHCGAWDDGVCFELVKYTPGKPLKIKIINQTEKSFHLFPLYILSHLQINNRPN